MPAPAALGEARRYGIATVVAAAWRYIAAIAMPVCPLLCPRHCWELGRSSSPNLRVPRRPCRRMTGGMTRLGREVRHRGGGGNGSLSRDGAGGGGGAGGGLSDGRIGPGLPRLGPTKRLNRITAADNLIGVGDRYPDQPVVSPRRHAPGCRGPPIYDRLERRFGVRGGNMIRF